jgi:GNAT superfamily N-acetyltransferase
MAEWRVETAPLPSLVREFVDVEYRVHADEPHFVPPLRSERLRLLDVRHNPFWRHAEIDAFLLRDRRGRARGRIAAIVDRNHDAAHAERAGFFGFFDVDEEAGGEAGRLFRAAEDALARRGAVLSRGPMNPSTNHECGLLVEGFGSPPAIMMPYNPPRYEAHVTAAGYARIEDLLAWRLTRDEGRFERVERVARRALGSRSMNLRTIDRKRLDDDLEIVRSIYNEAWADNFGFVPMERDEFRYAADSLRKVLVPDLALVAEVDGRPAGFAIALPDLNVALPALRGRLFPWRLPAFFRAMKKIRSIRVLTLGVRREHRNRGLDAILYLEIYRRGGVKGYDEGEFSWVLERNKLMNDAMRAIGASISKRYRLFEKPLRR